MARALSVDLAYTSYSKFGACLIEGVGRPPWRVEFVKPAALGLTGVPTPAGCAASLARFAALQEVDFLLLDGPQGWKDPQVPLSCRACDKELACPAKVGTEGKVKPVSYRGFVEFSIGVFTTLAHRWGMSLLRRGMHPRAGVILVESFPMAAWRSLGLPALSAKSRCSPEKLRIYNELLFWRLGFDPVFTTSHDELQALAGGITGPALAASRDVGFSDDARGYRLVGLDPVQSDQGYFLEGLVALPVPFESPAGASPPPSRIFRALEPGRSGNEASD